MLDEIIDDLILLSGGDIDEMEKIIKGEEEDEELEAKHSEGYKNINQTEETKMVCPDKREGF